jgi:hypothetical protein
MVNILGSVYGSGNYDYSVYNGASSATTGTGTTATTTTVTATGGSAGLLTNTGFDILLTSTLACLIIFTALMIRFWKRTKMATEPIEPSEHF